MVLGGFNSIAFVYTANRLIDFSQVMDDVVNNPANTMWLHAMLFSTIVPTLIHLCLVLYAVALGRGSKELLDKIDGIYTTGGNEVREWAYHYTQGAKWRAVVYLLVICVGVVVAFNYWHWPLWQIWDWANLVLSAVDVTYVTPDVGR